MQFNYLPPIRAQLALNQKDAPNVAEVPQAAAPYELGVAGTSLSFAPAQACFSARDLPIPAGAINASNGRAVGCRVSCNIEVGRFRGFRIELRFRQEG